ncbi:glycosyl transferase family 1 [Microlunatus endophyticus]|uniref:Glycosyl transferase family 1 n=2 Tax=Microlunatus endophyticus TaxID=1716077 RepID=A0A917S2B0_9ACTN|nr:glycosyl transferase family 1 [Microlunatus endophyticus]
MLSKSPRRALVITVVHDPRDSRIWFRQIAALLERGWQVTYAAAFSPDVGLGTEHLSPEACSRLRRVTLPRSRNRSRLRALLAVRQLLARHSDRYDVIVIHDPELLASTVGLHLPQLVWDVHEDLAASLGTKQWLPDAVHGPTARLVRSAEQWAEQQFTLLLAETAYQERFSRPHRVVPNAVIVPPDLVPAGQDRVIYLGSLTAARGSHLLPTIGRLLRERSDGRIGLEVIGPTHDDRTRDLLLQAQAEQDLVWTGFLPATQALERVRGALAGLSLLRDSPNYRHSIPTKLLEYCAYGVPFVTTPLPTAVDLVRRSGSGVVVGWDSPDSVVDAVLELAGRPGLAQQMGRRGHDFAMAEYDWAYWSQIFADELESVAARRSRTLVGAAG